MIDAIRWRCRRARGPAGALAGLLLAVGLFAGAVAAAAQADEIEPGIYRLAGIDDDLPHADLRPLDGILGRAKVVGLGEAVHTTAGFSRAKVRLFRYMVEELGFRAFGFESPWIEAERVADYVRTCEGSPELALQGLFSVWRNSSVLDLVRWMCEYNRSHPEDPVHFYGFDIQSQAASDIAALREFLPKIGVREDDKRYRGIADCSIVRGTLAPQPVEKHQRCLTALDRLWKRFERKERKLLRKVSREELEWARIHVVGLRSWEDEVFYFDNDFSRAFSARDVGMAYVALAIRGIRAPKARTALWAHNAHIARGPVLPGIRVMGQNLAETLRKRYRALGLVAYEADIDWPGQGCGRYRVAMRDSVEWLLRELGEPYLLVDLAFPGAVRPFLEPGRRYTMNWDWRVVPRGSFDGLLYMEKADRMIPISRPPC